MCCGLDATGLDENGDEVREAESACLAKMLRHMAAGEFDKATKLSKKCPKQGVVKSA